MPNLEVVLHIGMHKTGTSSIQSFLSINYEEILEENDVLYVKSGRDTDAKHMHAGHHRLAWSTVERYADRKNRNLTNKTWDEALEEIEAKNPKKAIISSEFFWPAKRGEINEIKDVLGGKKVKVLIYVRNQASIAKSFYKQIVKSEEYFKSIKNMVKKRAWYFDYEKVLKKWTEVFGPKNTDIRIYDRVDGDIVEDFAEAIGIETEGRREPVQNVSPPDCVVHLLRVVNAAQRIAPSPCKWLFHRARRNIVAQRQPGKKLSEIMCPILPSHIMSSSDRDWFREETKEMRARFLEEYVAPEDYHLFDV